MARQKECRNTRGKTSVATIGAQQECDQECSSGSASAQVQFTVQSVGQLGTASNGSELWSTAKHS